MPSKKIPAFGEPTLRLALAIANEDESHARIAANIGIPLARLLHFVAGVHIGKKAGLSKAEAFALHAYLAGKGIVRPKKEALQRE